MGYPEEKFVEDYEVVIMHPEQLEDLQNPFYQTGQDEPRAVDIYIEKFFSMKVSNNRSFDYSSYYHALENLDNSLYRILNKFWNSWLNFDVEDPLNYRPMMEDFLQEMEEWIEARQFSKVE